MLSARSDRMKISDRLSCTEMSVNIGIRASPAEAAPTNSHQPVRGGTAASNANSCAIRARSSVFR